MVRVGHAVADDCEVFREEIVGHAAKVLKVEDVAQEDAIVLEVFHVREALQVERKDAEVLVEIV